MKFSDITNYKKPTQDEIERVLVFWESVRASVNTGGRLKSEPSPEQDLLNRVAAHQLWESAMLCTHSGGVTVAYGEPMMCSDCERPMQFLSDVQVQALKE